MNEKKVLGRGLSSLIRKNVPQAPQTNLNPVQTPQNTSGVLEVSISSVRINPRQPRKYFDTKGIEELASSIKNTGVLQPIIVRKIDDGYELIAGERRLRASKLAGLKRIPILIKNCSDKDQLEIALVENLQRRDLSPIEEAKGYERLAQDFSMTQEEIAKRVGKERSTISNLVRLLKLSPLVQDSVNKGELSMGHARALLGIENMRQQEEAARQIVASDMSVRGVENLIKENHKPSKKSEVQKTNPNLNYFCEKLQQKLGTKVRIVEKGKGGEIRIQYFAPDELMRISKHLL